jgi:hypothetical protein
MTALVNLKGYAAPETKAAEERALSLIQEAEALGEPPEDPLLLFSVLHGVWWANYVALNGVVMRELAAQLLSPNAVCILIRQLRFTTRTNIARL